MKRALLWVVPVAILAVILGVPRKRADVPPPTPARRAAPVVDTKPSVATLQDPAPVEIPSRDSVDIIIDEFKTAGIEPKALKAARKRIAAAGRSIEPGLVARLATAATDEERSAILMAIDMLGAPSAPSVIATVLSDVPAGSLSRLQGAMLLLKSKDRAPDVQLFVDQVGIEAWSTIDAPGTTPQAQSVAMMVMAGVSDDSAAAKLLGVACSSRPDEARLSALHALARMVVAPEHDAAIAALQRDPSPRIRSTAAMVKRPTAR